MTDPKAKIRERIGDLEAAARTNDREAGAAARIAADQSRPEADRAAAIRAEVTARVKAAERRQQAQDLRKDL